MGSRGPVPKRQIERRRTNASSAADTVEVRGRVAIPGLPRGDEAVHPIARRLYNSLRQSAQRVFFEPSDWAQALLAVELTTKALNARTSRGRPRAISGEVINAIFWMWESLLTTEVARRRARIEIQRIVDEDELPAGVTAIEQYRQVLEEDD